MDYPKELRARYKWFRIRSILFNLLAYYPKLKHVHQGGHDQGLSGNLTISLWVLVPSFFNIFFVSTFCTNDWNIAVPKRAFFIGRNVRPGVVLSDLENLRIWNIRIFFYPNRSNNSENYSTSIETISERPWKKATNFSLRWLWKWLIPCQENQKKVRKLFSLDFVATLCVAV